jgi:OFA family oxalate/formate antiporter-like MFS transporter
MIFLGMYQVWSIFRASLMPLFASWSATQISLTFTICMITFCMGLVFGGNLLLRLSNKGVSFLSGLCLFIAFFGISMILNTDNPAASLYALYVFYGGFCGFGTGIGYIGQLGTLVRWFPDRTGLASGLLLMGNGLGALVLGGFCNGLIANYGIFTVFRGIGIAMILILGLSALLLKKPDDSTGAELKALAQNVVKKGQTAANAPAVDCATAQILKTPNFWLLFFWFVFVCSGGLLVINSAAQIALSFGVPAVLGLAVTISNGIGRVTFGSIFDKYGMKTTITINTIALLLGGLVLVLAAVAGQAFLMVVGLLLVGLSYGASPAINSAVTNAMRGSKYYAGNYAVMACSLIPAAILGPIIASALQERSGGKSYISNFIMLVALALIAFIIKIIIDKNRRTA